MIIEKQWFGLPGVNDDPDLLGIKPDRIEVVVEDEEGTETDRQPFSGPIEGAIEAVAVWRDRELKKAPGPKWSRCF